MKIMENFKNIFVKKISRKKFFLLSAVSAAAVYTLVKMPFGFLFSKKEKAVSKNYSIKITLNPEAVSRNSKVQNG